MRRILCLLVGMWGLMGIASAEDHVAKGRAAIQATTKFFAGIDNRYEGVEGNTVAGQRILEACREAGVPCGSLGYETAVFLPGTLEVTVDGRAMKMASFLPNGVELSALPESFEGRLCYMGRGTSSELDGENLKGALCVFDFNCGHRYLDVMKLGAVGVLFLPPDDQYTSSEASEKVLSVPLSVPRFQVAKEDADGLKGAAMAGATFQAKATNGRWEKRQLDNYWALVEGRSPAARQELVILHANIDSLCYLPAVGSGAQEAVNAHWLLEQVRAYAKEPADRSVLFLFHNSSHSYLTGLSTFVQEIFGAPEQILVGSGEAKNGSMEQALLDAIHGQTFLVGHYEKLSPDEMTADSLRLFREINERSAGKNVKASEPFMQMIEQVIFACESDNAFITNEMRSLRGVVGDGEEARKVRARVAEIEAQIEKNNKDREFYGDLIALFNRFGSISNFYYELPDDAFRAVNASLTGAQARMLDAYARRMLDAAGSITDVEMTSEEKAVLADVITTVGGDAADEDAALKKFTDAVRRSVERDQQRRLKHASPVVLTLEQHKAFWRMRDEVLNKARMRLADQRAQAEHFDAVRALRKTLFEERQLKPLLALGVYTGYNSPWISMTSGLEARAGYASQPQAMNRMISQLNVTFRNRANLLAEDIARKSGVSWEQGKPDSLLFPNTPPTAALQFAMQRIPGFDFQSPYETNPWLLAENDTFDRINPELVAKKQSFLTAFIRKLADDMQTHDNLTSAQGDGWTSLLLWHTGGCGMLSTRLQDGSSFKGVSRILENALVVLPISITDSNNISSLMGGMLMRRVLQTDSSGSAFYYNLPVGVECHSSVYRIDDAGRIVVAREMGTATKYTSTISPKEIMTSKMLAGFECRKADLYDLFNPTSLTPLSTPTITQRNGGVMRWYATEGFVHGTGPARAEGYACIFADWRVPFKLLMGGVVVLHSQKDAKTEGEASGSGFLLEQYDRMSVALQAMHDIRALNDYRVGMLKAHSVSNDLVDRFQARGKVYIDGNESNEPSMAELQATGRYQAFRERLFRGYGALYSAYPQIRGTMMDMMKAAIFYLAVLIPFSFFLQRLLFNFANIHAQIGVFAIIFMLTYFVFYIIHPAFQIARNPQIVIVAFVMMVMAGFVSFALKGKFDFHMDEFKKRFQSETDVGILKLAGTAMLLGVSNMKRRRLRTLLTCITIMLITFTMLSFTSVSQSVDPIRVLKAEEATYNGVFYSSNVWSALGINKVELWRNVLGKDCKTLTRAFATYDANTARVIFGSDQTRPIPLQALLAIEQEEDGWLRPLPLESGRMFSSTDAREIIVTDEFAQTMLGLELKDGEDVAERGVMLTLDGMSLKLVGIVNARHMQAMKDLRGDSILPQVLARNSAMGAEGQKVTDMGDEVPEGTFRPVEARYYVVVPMGLREVFNLPIRSVSVRMDNSQMVWSRIMDLVHYSHDHLYFGATEAFDISRDPAKPVMEQPGRYYLSSGFSSSIGGLASLIIPLLISATIIFNTMLGAVYERKREIGIYNAIGLNPIHIALFFVAEAVVYGILGGVGGYLVGQVLATVIDKFDLLSGINLNYSSTTVVYVILLSVLIVVLSTLYPALMAMRTASSSSGRRRPERVGENGMRILFPYSFTDAMAIAANSYLREYFDKHCDSSVGDFVADFEDCQHDEHEDGTRTMVLQYRVALAPYDLGVTQTIRLMTSFQPDVGALMVTAETERISGQESNWVGANQPFLNGIRQYLLHWRVLSREGQEAHRVQGAKMFGLELPEMVASADAAASQGTKA